MVLVHESIASSTVKLSSSVPVPWSTRTSSNTETDRNFDQRTKASPFPGHEDLFATFLLYHSKEIYCFATNQDAHLAFRSAIILGDDFEHEDVEYGKLWIEPPELLHSLWGRGLPSIHMQGR